MPPLEGRKVRILQAIVQDYVTTTRPVGSERLIEIYKLGCKPATVRNEMAEMAEMGYLVQPHTSAGRIPTDRGYRYYVDELMDAPSALPPTEMRRIQVAYEQAQSEIETIIQSTCRLLSELTSYPSLATDPLTATTTLRQIYLTAASPRHALTVVLLSTGHVEHRLVYLEKMPSDRMLVQIANYLNTLVADHELEEVGRALAVSETPDELTAHTAPLIKIRAALQQAAHALSERRVYLEGTNQILRQPEFKDAQRLEALLNALEQRNMLYQVLSRALRDADVTIIIGSENEYEPMQECSVMTTPYHIGTRPAGYLGVVGPTRMHYDHTATAVGLMARNLSQMLTTLTLA